MVEKQRPFLSFGLLSLLTLLLGCGPELPETIRIEGTVRHADGSVPEHCSIYFRPVESPEIGPTRPASSRMEADGRFTVTSYRPSDGLRPGKYSVLVEYFTLRDGGDRTSESGWRRHTYEPESLLIEAGTYGAVNVDYVIPADQ